MTVRLLILRVLFLCSVLFTVLPEAWSTVLGPGDIAFTSYNSDGNNRFSFVLLTDISDSTAIYFTDNGWDASASVWYNNTEGTIFWYYNGYLPCGTEIQIDPTLGTVNLGVYSMLDPGFNPLTSGDAILAYVGTAVGVQTAFVSGINASSAGWVISPANDGETSLPPGLVDAVNAIELTANIDNWVYDCSLGIGPSVILSSEINSVANWNSDDVNEYTAPDCIIGCGDFTGGPSMSGAGNALTFDGVDDHLVLPDSAIYGMGNAHIKTIELWFKSTLVGTSNEYLFSTGSSLNSNGYWLGFAGSNAVLRLEINDFFGPSVFVESTTPVRGDGKWHHAAAVFNGPNATIYVDGVFEGSVDISGEGPIRPSGLAHLGNSYDNAAFSYFTGSIDEFRVWNTTMPVGTGRKRMCQKLNLSHPQILNILGYYNFDQSSNSQLIDLAAGNHATLVNMDTNAAWQFSGAALGNRSSNDYAGGAVREVHSNGDSLVVSNYNGILAGIHVYLVQDPPNYTTMSGASAQNNAYHFGVFKVGADSTTYDVTYDYSGTALLTGSATEYRVGLAKRENNTDSIWESQWFEGTTNTAVNTVFLPGQTGTHYAGIVAANNALDFDGSDDAVTTVPGANVSGAFTVEARVSVVDQAISRTILSTRPTVSFDNWELSVLPSEQVEFRIGVGSGWLTLTSATSLTPVGWNHVAAVYNGDSTISLFIDGVEEATRNDVIGYSYDGSLPLEIGSIGSTASFFTGLIDEVRVWQRELCVAEIADYSTCEFDTTQNGLMAYYSFNQGVADANNVGLDSLIDQSGNGFNGTLQNFALSGVVSNWRAGSTGISGVCTPTGYAQIQVTSEGNTILNGDLLPAVIDSTNFGTIQLGQTFSVTYDIENIGLDTLFLTNVSFLNSLGGTFNSTYPPFILPANTGRVKVIISPTVADTVRALVSISSNDCDASPYQFLIEGVAQNFAGALHFDGTNDYVDIPSSAANSLTNTWTLEGWFKPDALPATWQALIAKDEIPWPASLWLNGPNVEIWFGASGTASLVSVQTLNVGEWVHLAATFDHGDMRLYINGVLDNQVAYVGATPTSPTPYHLGYGETTYYYQGEMDEVRIWNRPRNLNEIQSTLTCELDGDECNLVHYFNFNNPAAFPGQANPTQVVAGDSALTANGTLVNFALTGNTSNWVLQSDSVGDNCSLLGDNVLPIVLPFDTVTVNLAGLFTLLTPAVVDSASCDYYSGIDTMWVVPDTVICGMNGTTGYLFVQDSAGLIDSAAFILEVIDVAPPVLFTNDITIWLDGTGNASILPVALDSASFDNCQIAQFASSDSTFTCANVGVNTVILTATDTNGLSTSGNVLVTVLDTFPPTVIALNATIYLPATGTFTLDTSLIDGGSTDNCALDSMWLSRTLFDCLDAGTVDSVWLFGRDLSGNIDSALSLVTIVDSIFPTVNAVNYVGFLDAEGKKVEIDETGSTIGTIVTAELAEGTETFTFAEDAAPPPGTMVYVTDKNDVVIDSAEVDEFGEIRFTRLPVDGNYKLKLDKAIDGSMGLDRFFIIDAEGEKIGFNENGESLKEIVGVELAASTETFTFSEEGAPPAGTMVYVTDENDNIIDSAEVDEFGEIRFTRLPPDGNYKLKLDKAVDMSAGLDRFFIVDAEGDKIGFNADGETVKTIVGAELAETTETFTFEGDSGPPPGTIVYVTDENDNIIDSAEVDEFGEIRFTRLPPDGNYKLKLDKAIDNSMGLDRFFITDATGEKVGFNADGTSEMTLVSKSKAIRTDYYKFNYGKLPPQGSKVYLYDASGFVIDSAIVDANGGFRFKRLNSEKDYSLKVVTPDGSEFSSDYFDLIDKSGKVFKLNPLVPVEDFFAEMSEEDMRLNYEMFQFDFNSLPKSGSKVYLYNERGYKIDSTLIYGIGSFNFEKLDELKTYYVKVKDKSFKQGSAVLYALVENSKRQLNYELLGFEYRPIDNLDKTEDTQLNISEFLNIPAEEETSSRLVGPVAYLIDPASNTRIDSVVIDKDGAFRFNNQTSSEGVIQFNDSINGSESEIYAVSSEGRSKLESSEKGFKYSASMSGSDLIVVPKEQKPVEVEQPKIPTTYPPLPEAYLALSSKERYSGYDQFQFDEENVPAPGSKVYISNDEGERLQTATIYENGIFIADKITEPGNYLISTNDPDFNNESGRLHNLTSEGRVEMKKDGDGYIYTVKQGISEEKIDQERSNFVLVTTSELTGEQSVFLYDLDEKRYTDTLKLAEDGSFVVDNLDRTKTYRVEFDSAIETQDAQLFAILGDEKDEIEKENGEFILNPIDLLNAEGQQLRVSFLNAEGVPVEEPKEEIEKDENEEPYPLTPPVNDNEESIDVEESVVNNTVFENPPVKEEPKVKKAVASVDYSDFRLKDGSFAEVVETRKGWNLHFDFNEFLLSQNQMDYVYEVLIPLLRENPNMTLVLEGHTDSIGSNDVNYRMSVLRISNVLYHNEMNGIEDTRITVRPKGESEPLAPNSTEEGRAINRRVEIIKTPEDQK